MRPGPNLIHRVLSSLCCLRSSTCSEFVSQESSNIENSPDHQGSPPPRNYDNDEDIQAFRTITTLLSWLPRRTPIEPAEYLYDLVENYNSRKAVKVSDAFARCVAVAEGDVAAVTTSRIYDRFEGTTTLHIVVCVNAPSYDDNDEGVSQETACHPTILIPSPPPDLGERHAFVYMKDLLKNWEKPSLADHLWILGNVLGPGTEQTPNKQKPEVPKFHTKPFVKYILAVSHQRIARRVNKPLSRAFIESLREVKDIPPVSPSMGGSEKTVASEFLNDGYFLAGFVKNKLPSYSKQYQFSIANISKVIKPLPDNPTSDDVKALQLYTDETAAEFHQLLVALLDHFTDALDALEHWDTQDEATQGTKAAKKAFFKHLSEAYRAGLALAWLSKGQMLKMHLENISGLLKDPRHLSSPQIAEEERDAELEALVADPRTSFVSYSKRDPEEQVVPHIVWLRYIVSHIHAVEVLVENARTSKPFPYDIVSVGALLVPPVSAPAPHAALLPCSALFDNEKQYIPDEIRYGTIGVSDIFDVDGNKELKQNLEEAITMAEKGVQDTEDLRDAFNDWEESQTPASCSTLQTYLEGLVSSNSDKEVQTHAKAIVTKLTHWTELASAIPDSDLDRSQIAREVTRKVKAFHDVLLGEPEMSEYHSFFLRLRDMSETKFTGTLHSEVCLASLLPAFTNSIISGSADAQYNDINNLPNLQDYPERIIGVSGRCCPICTEFFLALNNTSTGRPLVRGQHSTLSACTLPPWTPSAVVKKMNHYFGLRLRFDLQGFISEFSMLRDRRKKSPEPYDSYSESDDGCIST